MIHLKKLFSFSLSVIIIATSVFFQSAPLVTSASTITPNLSSDKNSSQALISKNNFGLKPKSAKDDAWIKNNMVHTTNATLNSLGLTRVNAAKASKNLNTLKPGTAVSIGEETSTTSNSVATTSVSLPLHIDNSALPAFPPIRSQDGLGSCAAFGTTYYQMSYMVNLQEGRDAKNDPNDNNKFSPKWTYNLLNNGEDKGLFLTDAYKLMSDVGTATWSDFPYVGSDTPITNYTSWPTSSKIWKNAQKYKIDKSGYINIGDSSTATPVKSLNDANLQTVKTMLSDGYVFTFATDIISWYMHTIKDDKSTSSDDSFIGQPICDWCANTHQGPHCMTLVGYDDNIWSDINHNGIVDPGEKGAFKVANSWGTNIEFDSKSDDPCKPDKNVTSTDGFLWVSYDALNSISAVPNNPWPNSKRVKCFWDENELYWILPKAVSSAPKTFAQLTLNTANRSQVRVTLSSTDNVTGKTNSYTYTPVPLNAGSYGSFSFDGTTSSNDGTFVIDLSGLLQNNNIPNLLSSAWNIKVEDTTSDNNKLQLKDFRLIDDVNNKQYVATISSPIICNGNSQSLYFNADPVSTPTNLTSGYITSNSIQLLWSPSTSSSVTKYAIYRNDSLVGFSTNSSYTDTGLSPITNYNYTVKGINSAGVYSLNSLPTMLTTDSNKITVYYKSTANRNLIHYGINGLWTTSPGMLMSDSIIHPGYKEYTINLGESTSAAMCFNLNNSNWDNNNSKNYILTNGLWMIDGDAHTTTKLPDFQVSAPNNLTALNVTNTSVTLTWTPSYGDIIVGGYNIYRNGNLYATVIGSNSYTDNYVNTTSNQYTYYVRAQNTYGTEISKESNLITVGTKSGNTVIIYYKQGYTSPYIHYCPSGGTWTTTPGLAMPVSEISGYNKIILSIGNSTSLQACFNDGNGHWDNNSSKNYTFGTGTYTYTPGINGAAGTIKSGVPVQ